MAPPVLTAYDGHSPSSARLGEQLAALLGLPLHVATAYRYQPAALGSGLGLAPDNELRLEAAERALEALSLGPETTRSSLPADGIAQELLQLAGELGAAAIVVGADRHGHVTRDVVQHSTCPVVVAPHDPMLLTDPLQAVGVAFDGSVTSRFALAAGRRLAIAPGARLDIVAVSGHAHETSALLRRVDEAADAQDVVARGLVRRGRAADELRRACEHLDVLVCGSRGRGTVLGAVLGSVSSQLVDDPICPIVVIPVRARLEAGGPLGLTKATRP